MSRVREAFDVPWDHHSGQPHVVADRALKRRVRLRAWPEHLTTLATVAVAGPVAAAASLAGAPGLARPGPWPAFLGCGLSPHPALPDLVAELGLRRALIRVPTWDAAARDAALATITALRHLRWLVVLPQDRAAIRRPQRWATECAAIARDLPRQVEALQVGNASNRLKWGCVTMGDYLDAAEHVVPALRRARPDLPVAGSAVIDFEPHATLRSLINRHRHRFDAVSALLYVDRRGGPAGRQYGIFDTAAKIRCVAGCVAAAPRHRKRLWLTEVNWPLAGQGGWAPTSEAECVDPATAAAHLEAYCRTAYASGLVERVYIWQLMARGYGLVGDADGRLERRPAFAVLKRLLHQPILEPCGWRAQDMAPALRQEPVGGPP